MNLQLNFPTFGTFPKIDHSESLFMMGSCFANKIAQKLIEDKFILQANPNGILYGPVSIANSLTNCMAPKKITDRDLFSENGIWHSWDFHSSFSGTNKTKVLREMNRSMRRSHRFIQEADWLFLTFGSAFQYYYIGEDGNQRSAEMQTFAAIDSDAMEISEMVSPYGRPVANCHKVAAEKFNKILISPEEIVRDLKRVFVNLKRINPKIKILLTVSPVRHIRDGIIENNQSKASLIIAVHRLAKEMVDTFYFPSYEILIDVLRDYRFYDRDLVHPNDLGVEIIWEQFQACFFSRNTQEINDKIRKIVQVGRHKPFFPKSKDYQALILKTIRDIKQLESSVPGISLASEEATLLKGLIR